MEWIKKLLFGLLVLGLSLVIFLLVSENNPFKSDILENSLSLLGQPLLAMVHEGQDREILQKWYNDFIHQVKRQEIPPERVEEVACIILNAENMDTTFSAKDLTHALDLVLAIPESRPPGIFRLDELTEIPIPTPEPEPLPEIEKAPEPEAFAALGSRLEEIYQINQELRNLKITIKHEAPELSSRKLIYEFRTDSGLHVRIDPEVKTRLQMIKKGELSLKLKKLEQRDRVIWEQTLLQDSRARVHDLIVTKQAQAEQLARAKKIYHEMTVLQDSIARQAASAEKPVEHRLDSLKDVPE